MIDTPAQDIPGDQEKKYAAKSSVMAAVGLTGLKIAVGLSTGSLGILAEAAHSGLDLAAAAVTWWAIHVAGKPADRDHRYGHGKVENLSALFETLLLLITCGWIIHSAADRLISRNVEIEVNVWSFLVMFVSIAVDVSRSRLLFRAAKKYNSQALEADALHFSTDIWSSAVVILGLFCVKLSEWLNGYEFLHYADAVAAIVVALIVVKVSVQLGWRTVSALLDTAPVGMEEQIVRAVERIPGVKNCHQVRLRPSGPVLFVDLHVLVDGRQSIKKAHALTEEIEQCIQKIVPHSDITVHPEPG
ncbi:MAG TPA: cation diffusion facilitator family transporter [Elusimicrobiota bacterium]|nr:cation diffusion facilitator family transporter [Elusimicrobiota bacterium]